MNQPTITDIFPEPTYEELETALKEWMDPDNDSSDVSTPSIPTTATSTTTTETKPDEKKTDVAAAFNELFNT